MFERKAPHWRTRQGPSAGRQPPTWWFRHLRLPEVAGWNIKRPVNGGGEAQAEKPVSIYWDIRQGESGNQIHGGAGARFGHVWLPRRFRRQVNATALGFIKKDCLEPKRARV